MANYTNEYSHLPNKIMELHNFKDVTDDIASIINQIKSLQSKGSYNEASKLIEQNKDILGQCMLSTEYLNAIDEETRNLEIMAKSKAQSIYYQATKPSGYIVNDVWIGA